jgi:hypothetical protein
MKKMNKFKMKKNLRKKVSYLMKKSLKKLLSKLEREHTMSFTKTIEKKISMIPLFRDSLIQVVCRISHLRCLKVKLSFLENPGFIMDLKIFLRVNAPKLLKKISLEFFDKRRKKNLQQICFAELVEEEEKKFLQKIIFLRSLNSILLTIPISQILSIRVMIQIWFQILKVNLMVGQKIL